MIPRALTIAGSDSGGGAGIQADLKTFHQLQVYGMSVITVLTAQNTLGVQGVYPQTKECIEQQLRSVLSDIGADAVKTGMLYSAEIISCVANYLRETGVRQLVIDPVMIAKGGTPLLQEEAVDALRSLLLPLATVIMPNLPEACRLAGLPLTDRAEDMEDVARALHALGPRYVLLKGGHLGGGDAVDLLYDGHEMLRLASPRIATRHTHGTGCTLSAALTAELAKGRSVQQAFATAKAFIDAAIGQALAIGGGIGPTHHGAYSVTG
ncbi:bifunctional hydroxymethylpyrimidine kinase/phosphomethylpyrimidine kinase [Paenibacillus daejeonensis]|uniref:bifunctional hydroxymethylpyrimidine kinase/phosphomethylpyrimidine kinase n=1 Tax=Paenibacillus daejeonensis TaxID=135193 RepID=UPI00036CA5B1|nr:bifunctional hydroxymethylpyrimidine kinase/phosphomethylpyrimidine kinase [Paenibacillus daejeonensis]